MRLGTWQGRRSSGMGGYSTGSDGDGDSGSDVACIGRELQRWRLGHEMHGAGQVL